MIIRFQADADLNEDIVLGVTRLEPQIDFQSAGEAGLRGLSDSEVLSGAAQDNRILVSHDRRTMPQHFTYPERHKPWSLHYQSERQRTDCDR